MTPKFGDYARCHIAGTSYVDFGYVVGEMAYSDNGDVVLICDEQYTGMPINKQWLAIVSEGHFDAATKYRKRYENKFNSTTLLKPLSEGDGHE